MCQYSPIFLFLDCHEDKNQFSIPKYADFGCQKLSQTSMICTYL